MKTKNLIRILQEADPSGELHVRLSNGSTVSYALKNEGYYDGYYSYIDGDGNFVITKEGYKIDLYEIDEDLFIELNVGRKTKWSDIEEKFIFKSIPEEEKERILTKAKKTFKEIKELDKKYIK